MITPMLIVYFFKHLVINSCSFHTYQYFSQVWRVARFSFSGSKKFPEIPGRDFNLVLASALHIQITLLILGRNWNVTVHVFCREKNVRIVALRRSSCWKVCISYLKIEMPLIRSKIWCDFWSAVQVTKAIYPYKAKLAKPTWKIMYPHRAGFFQVS